MRSVIELVHRHCDGRRWPTLLAFTGTPISEADRNTREIFGDYIDVYDLKRAADDGATVKVVHESRVIQLVLDKDVDSTKIDEEADRITDGLDVVQDG